MTFGKALRVTNIFYKKQSLPVITKNIKHSSKQVMPMTYKLEKKVVAATYLKV